MKTDYAMEAIDDLANDRSDTPEQAIENLEEVRDHINIRIEALRIDADQTEP